MLWKVRQTNNADRQVADHRRPIRYELPMPDQHSVALRDRKRLYVHSVSRRG
jgi:magnesium-protoporphyrin IX monomethyl ester (oxidative) cyclase